MSDKLLRGMVEAYENAVMPIGSRLTFEAAEHGMSEAILWLSENVTQEMLDAADYELGSDDSFVTKEVIAAALRKAAGK
jgi:hypothetical protein